MVGPKRLIDSNGIHLAILLTATALLYAASLDHSFSPLDEQWLLVNNLKNLSAPDAFLKIFSQNIQGVYYRPLLLASLLVDYKMAGMTPAFFHFSNVVMHCMCGLLLYHFMKQCGIPAVYAFLFGLLFLVHPLNVHAVAWVPGRNDILLCFFGLLSLVFLQKYLNKGRPMQAALHLMCFAMALLSKESAIALPLVYLALTLRNNSKSLKYPFLWLAWSLLLAGWWVIWNKMITGKMPLSSMGIFVFVKGLVIMLGKTVFPFRQSVSPTVENSSWPAYLALLVMSIVFALLFFRIEERRTFYFGIAAGVVLMLLPVWFGSQTLLGEQYEHRAYLPLAMFCIGYSQLRPKAKKTGYAVVAVVLVSYCAKSLMRQEVYRSELTYLQEGVRDCEKNYLMQAQLANNLLDKRRYSEALHAIGRALELNPGKAQLYHTRAGIFEMTGKMEACIADYSKALELSKNDKRVLLSRCLAYRKMKRPDLALADLQAIKAQTPGFKDANLEATLRREWIDLRVESLSGMIEKDPADALLYVNRAQAYIWQRKGAEALEDLKMAMRLDPGNGQFRAYYEKLQASLGNSSQSAGIK